MALDETRRRVAHLLRRAGFGAAPEEIERCARQGVEATVDELLDYQRVPDQLDKTLGQVNDGLLDLNTLDDAQTWWLYRMIETQRPLEEKMTLFWHGHFATANSKVRNPILMHRQNHLFRTHALGNFQKLTLEVSKDPAMLIWLDNDTNRKASPNENYARELMELFTLGIGNYGEQDVREVARAFTGWNLATPNRGGMMSPSDGPTFRYNANQHDNGPKTILGRAGSWNGDDAIGLILGHPAHAAFLTGRLFRFFAYDNPDPAVIAPLARVYRDATYEIKPLLRALFLSNAFYSEAAYTQHVKSPVEYVVGTVRTLGLTARTRSLLAPLAAMGQELYNPPHVGGWPSGRGWLNPSVLLERFNFAARLTALTGRPPADGGLFDPAQIVSRFGLTAWDQAITTLVAAITDRDPSPALRAALLGYIGAAPLDGRSLDMKLRGLVHLIITAAEGQTS